MEYCHYDRNHCVFSQTLICKSRLGEKFGDNYAVDNIDLDIYQHESLCPFWALRQWQIHAAAHVGRAWKAPIRAKSFSTAKTLPNLLRTAPNQHDVPKLCPVPAHEALEQNIAFGLKQDKMPKGEIDARVEEMLRLVQMKYAKRKPHQLSGGQQQRIAGAQPGETSKNPMLLDEPLGALDKNCANKPSWIGPTHWNQSRRNPASWLPTTRRAMTMATRNVAIMSDGQLRQVGTPSDVYDY